MMAIERPLGTLASLRPRFGTLYKMRPATALAMAAVPAGAALLWAGGRRIAARRRGRRGRWLTVAGAIGAAVVGVGLLGRSALQPCATMERGEAPSGAP